MKNRISYIVAMSIIATSSNAEKAYAKSQFLPEAKESFSEFSKSEINIYSPIQTCKDLGYTVRSCNSGYVLSDPCPYGISTGYYKKCVAASEVCTNKGYTTSCEDGYEPDYGQRCSEDELYTKCKCASCVGYYYTAEEANIDGYVADGDPCISCGEEKYKRKINPCEGFEYDSTNCGVTSCGQLEGETCLSGSVLKYKECGTCPTPACPEGTVNYDTYFCDGALRCYWPSTTPSCTQTMCFDYTYSESVTCKTGYVKKSCTDPCVGTRYKCEEQICTPTADCSSYPLTSQTGCSYGYDTCNDGCNATKYKCKTCTPTTDCSSYTLTSQTGCNSGYVSCNDGCGGATKYKCKGYAVGDKYYLNGIFIAKVIEVSGTDITIATPLVKSNAEIADYCSGMSPGSWSPPTKKTGKKIFKAYRGDYDSDWSYLRINGNNDSYCIEPDGDDWWKSECKSSIYTLYNSCTLGVKQEQ